MNGVNPANIERFSGFAETYDRHRPTPPIAILDLLTQVIETPRPALVVDIGSGTGLSTRIWIGRAQRVIGVEPNADMRAIAAAGQRTGGAEEQVEYRDGDSTATALTDGCADIVTISQALHWMEPEPTFAEVGRILRPGGIFAAYDCDWPPTITAELTEAYRAFDERSRRIEQQHGCSPRVRHYAKGEHLSRIRGSRCFQLTWEVVLHSIESGDAHRLVQLAMSQGDVQACLRAGVTPQELGVPEFQATADRIFQARTLPWYFSYRVRLGVK